jgi:hypothetical protein
VRFAESRLSSFARLVGRSSLRSVSGIARRCRHFCSNTLQAAPSAWHVCVATHPGGVRLGERVFGNELYSWETGMFDCAGGAGIDL